MATTKVRYNQIKTGLPVGGDVNYDDVSLLLNMEGSNGSTTFIDSSNANRTVSVNGSAAISTDQFKFNGSSAEFTGADGDYLNITSSSDFVLNSSDFTVETWAYIETETNPYGRFIMNWDNNWGSNKWGIHSDHDVGAPTKFSVYAHNAAGDNPFLKSSSSISFNTWYHVAFTRSGNTFRLFIDGTEEDSAVYTGSLDNNASAPIYIGGNDDNVSAIDGYIDNVRITNNVARYTSNFSVPTAAFPAFESKEGKRLVVNANESIELES